MKKKPTGWKYKVDNKMRNFGETDFKKKIVRINKKAHKIARKTGAKYAGLSKKETTLINTEVHEMMHRRHPRMTEKDVRKKTRLVVERMSRAQKQRVYGRFK